MCEVNIIQILKLAFYSNLEVLKMNIGPVKFKNDTVCIKFPKTSSLNFKTNLTVKRLQNMPTSFFSFLT